MSFRAPKIRKRRTSNSPSKFAPNSTAHHDEPLPPSHHHLVEPHLAPRRRRGYGTKGLITFRHEGLLAEPNRRVFTQPLFVARSFARPRNQPTGENEDFEDDPFAMDLFPGSAQPESPIRLHVRELETLPEANRLKARKKKERQWMKWANDVIPSLVHPYMRYIHATQSLREPPHGDFALGSICTCGKESLLTVICVYFERKLMSFLSELS